MSYCVNCGVALDSTAHACPLCQTPVINPRSPVDEVAPKPFPTQKVALSNKPNWGGAILISAMLLSVSVCCGLLNLFLRPERLWSLYIIGAAIMLWIWFVPPLLWRGMNLCARLAMDVVAVAIYVYLISLDLNGAGWYWHLALPIILLGGAIVLALGLILRTQRRSLLTSVTLVIGGLGVFLLGVEIFIDRFLFASMDLGWSLVVMTSCLALMIPLIVVRRVPALREEMRRRFHV